MKNACIFLLLSIIFQSYSQSKKKYLEENRADLTSVAFNFPQQNFKIIGFGAYHASAKTERAEIALGL